MKGSFNVRKYPSFQEMDQTEVDKNELLIFAKHIQGFLIFSGTNGSGKSYAAEAIYNLNTPYRLPQQDRNLAIFITQCDLNDECNASFQEHRLYLINEYKNTKLLVIDDLGSRKPTDSFMDFLYSIVDFRWRNNLGTIITTNLNSNEIRELFGDRFLSRIASGIVKRWNHQDRRIKAF